MRQQEAVQEKIVPESAVIGASQAGGTPRASKAKEHLRSYHPFFGQ